MNAIWRHKSAAIVKELNKYQQECRVLDLLGVEELPDEVRAVIKLDTPTLVRLPSGQIGLAGPVIAGIRYHQRFLSTAPHPMEIVTVLGPPGLYHPSGGKSGGLCLGHPMAGLSISMILHQFWAAVTLNMAIVNTVPGQIVNREAADFVRANAHRFPLRKEGLLEALPL